jgi:hypothetical protein
LARGCRDAPIHHSGGRNRQGKSDWNRGWRRAGDEVADAAGRAEVPRAIRPFVWTVADALQHRPRLRRKSGGIDLGTNLNSVTG